MGGEVIRAGRLTGGMDESRGRQKQLLAELEQHPAQTLTVNRNKCMRSKSKQEEAGIHLHIYALIYRLCVSNNICQTYFDRKGISFCFSMVFSGLKQRQGRKQELTSELTVADKRSQFWKTSGESHLTLKTSATSKKELLPPDQRG